MPLNFIDEIEIPDETDALYLGISSWGRMNGHSGPVCNGSMHIRELI